MDVLQVPLFVLVLVLSCLLFGFPGPVAVPVGVVPLLISHSSSSPEVVLVVPTKVGVVGAAPSNKLIVAMSGRG